MLEVSEIPLRLGSATVIGCLIGLNRDLHGKPTGVRTLGLVGLGSALVVLGMTEFSTPGDPNAVSRVVQGIFDGNWFSRRGRHISQYRNTAYLRCNYGGMRMVDCLYWNDVRYWRMEITDRGIVAAFSSSR